MINSGKDRFLELEEACLKRRMILFLSVSCLAPSSVGI